MNIKKLLLVLLVLLPISAFAHGEEVLLSLCYDLITVIALIIFILCIRWKEKGKVLLALVLIVSVVIPFAITSKWPYTANKILIDLLCVGVPLLSVLSAYFIFNRRFTLRKRNNLQ